MMIWQIGVQEELNFIREGSHSDEQNAKNMDAKSHLPAPTHDNAHAHWHTALSPRGRPCIGPLVTKPCFQPALIVLSEILACTKLLESEGLMRIPSISEASDGSG